MNHIPDRNTYIVHFTIPKTEVGTGVRDRAAYVAGTGAVAVDSHYIFELHNAIQARGSLQSLHFLQNANATPPTFTSPAAAGCSLSPIASAFP